MANIHLAVVAEFTLADKLLEALSQSELTIKQLTVVELTPFGEEQNLRFGTKAVTQIPLNETDWSQFSHILFAGNMTYAEHLAKAVQAGCIVLDLFGISALIGQVPVIVPSVNDEAITQLSEQNIVALANPQISQLALALKPLLQQPIQHIFVSSMVPTAYFGEEKVTELAGQTARLLNGIPFDDEAERIAFNAVPANVQTNETALPFSKAFELQLAKILPNLTACTTFHSVQVPVFYGLSQMISVQSTYPLDLAQLSEEWQHQKWVNFNQDTVITAVKNGENEAENALQISQLLASSDNCLQFWSVADEQKFSLAFLAIELLKLVLEIE